MDGTTRSAALLSVEPEDMSVASRGRALMPLVTDGWEHRKQCIAWTDQSGNISGGHGWTLDVTRRLCGVSSTMDWAEVEMVFLSLILGFPLRLNFADYFDRKVASLPMVRRRRLCSETFHRQTGCLPLCQCPVTTDVVCTLVRNAADKYSMKDPMPMWLFKTCIDLLAPYIASYCSTCRYHLAYSPDELQGCTMS